MTDDAPKPVRKDPNVKIHPTVQIVNPHKKGEFLVIAESEYKSDEHILFGDDAPAAKPVKTDNPPPAVDDFSKMSVKDMRAFAVANNINLDGKESKADITKALEDWKTINNPPTE